MSEISRLSGDSGVRLKEQQEPHFDGTESNVSSISTGTSSVPPQETTRQSSLQKIQQRKQKVFNLPKPQKMAKLSMYSACQTEGCRCTRWEKPKEHWHKNVESSYCPDSKEKCRNVHCKHSLASHISHLFHISNDQLNELLGAIIDLENIFISMLWVEHDDNKKVYFYLFRLLRKYILTRQRPVKGPLGYPPFETPCIAKAVSDFVFYKYNHWSQSELQTMTEMARTFLSFLNHCNFEPPCVRCTDITQDDESTYKINYTRWLVFCHVPAFCNSLRHFETSMIFGRKFFKAVYQYVAQQLLSNCVTEKDRVSAEKRAVLTQMPKFLDALKHEILREDSSIWDPTFRQQRKRQHEVELSTGNLPIKGRKKN